MVSLYCSILLSNSTVHVHSLDPWCFLCFSYCKMSYLMKTLSIEIFLSYLYTDICGYTIVCAPPPFSAAGGGGGWTSFQILQKGRGLIAHQLWEAVVGKEGVTCFREGCHFTKKINENLKYLMTKNVYNL